MGPRALVVTALLAGAVPSTAAAQSQTPPSPFDAIDPADQPAAYCPDTPGAAAGEATTDAEHRRIVPDRPPPSGVTRRRIPVAGAETRVHEAGPRGAREAVLFVHGNPGSSEDFLEMMSDVGRFARAIAFDVPGLGHASDAAGYRYGFEAMVRTIDDLLAQLGVDRVHLVMHDLGGPWALEWAAGHGDAVRSAVVINSGVFIDNYGLEHPVGHAWHTPGTGEAHMAATDRESFTSDINRENPKPLPREFLDRMYDDFDRPTRCAVLQYYRDIDNPDAQGRAQAAALRKRPDRPALVVWGAGDPHLPPEQAERQRQAFPSARIHMLEGAGHWPFVDEPERVRSLVAGFLRNVVPPPGSRSRAWAPPRLALAVRRARHGRRKLTVRVRAVNAPRIGRVVLRLHRGRARGPTVARRRLRGAVAAARRVQLRLRRGRLRAGRWTVVARAPGVAPERARVRVR